MPHHARSSRTVVIGLLALLLPLAAPARAGSPGDRVLVSGWSSNNVLGYDANGSFTGALLTAGNGLSLAHSLTMGPDGYVYVTSFGNDSVIRYDLKTGTNLGPFVTSGSGGLNGPSNAAFGPDGRLYVTGLLSGALHVYDGFDGTSQGTLINGLNGPESVLFNAAGNLLIVSGPGNSVTEYDTAGVFVGVFVTPGNGLSDPHDGVFGPDGNFHLPRVRPGDYIIEIRPKGETVYGPVSGTLAFDTGMAQEPRALFPIEGTVDAPLRVAPARVDLSGGARSTALTVSVRPGWADEPLSIRSEPEGIRHELKPVGQGVYELHVAWDGEETAEGLLTVSLGRDRVRVPVARSAGSRGR